MLYFSFSFTLVSLPAIALFFFLFTSLIRKKSSLAREKHVLDSEIEGFLSQCFHSATRIRASRAEERVASVWEKLVQKRDRLEWLREKSRIGIAILEIAFPFAAVASVLLFWIYSWDVVDLDDAVSFLIALSLLCSASHRLALSSFEALSALPVIKKGEKIFQEPKEMGEADPGRLKGGISFQNVSFRFDQDQPVLFDGLSFSIEPKEKIGIVGESGSGRSTLIRLLLGFEAPEKGVISLDGRNLATLRLIQVRRQIGSVFGVEGIFGASIFENIDAGRGCSQDQIEKALVLSGFEKEVRHFPMGLHTLLPDGGETLSGSQKQKLLLARALAFDPAILVIDEAIDALDLPSKEEIFHNLQKISATQIIVSRDEAFLKKHVEKVFRLHQGKIDPSG
jgi:ABC-type bacteriocin/lantibiotic exporter with double-glycine peptidase domain